MQGGNLIQIDLAITIPVDNADIQKAVDEVHGNETSKGFKLFGKTFLHFAAQKMRGIQTLISR